MRNRGFKVIQLKGLSGLVLIILIAMAIIGSLIVMPIYAIKFIWNSFISSSFGLPFIKLSQATLLWSACLLALFGYLKGRIGFKMVCEDNLKQEILKSEIDCDEFIKQIKKEQENEKIKH